VLGARTTEAGLALLYVCGAGLATELSLDLDRSAAVLGTLTTGVRAFAPVFPDREFAVYGAGLRVALLFLGSSSARFTTVCGASND